MNQDKAPELQTIAQPLEQLQAHPDALRQVQIYEHALRDLQEGEAPATAAGQQLLRDLHARMQAPEKVGSPLAERAFAILEATILGSLQHLKDMGDMSYAGTLAETMQELKAVWKARKEEKMQRREALSTELKATLSLMIAELASQDTPAGGQELNSAPGEKGSVLEIPIEMSGDDQATDQEEIGKGEAKLENEDQVTEETEEAPPLQGLIGLRLLLFVLKTQARVKAGGLGSTLQPRSREELRRFIDSVEATLRNKGKGMEDALKADMDMMAILLKKQECDQEGAQPHIQAGFEALDASQVASACKAILAYGRAGRDGVELPHNETWEDDGFQAGPFLMDALSIGRDLTDRASAKQRDLRGSAQEIVMKHSLRSAGVGVVPIPIVDLVGLGVITRAMVKELAELYGIPFNEVKVRSVIRSLIWEIGAVALGSRFLGSLGKMLPGAGTLMGISISAVTSGAITYAVGGVFVDKFSQGVNIKDILAHEVSADIKQKFQEGKKAVARRRNEPSA